MKFDIAFERTYPHPIDKVWHALTDRTLLAQWLMENDFVAEQDHEFTLLCEVPGREDERILCTVVELAAPNRMVWSWRLDGDEAEWETAVTFTLEEVAGGTHLRIRHAGDLDRGHIDDFSGGWPGKLDELGAALEAAG